MTFVNFKREELVGKHVAWHRVSNGAIVSKIIEAGREGFKIEGESNRLFSYFNGHELLNGKKTQGERTRCRLLSNEQAEELGKKIDSIAFKKVFIDNILAKKDLLVRLDDEILKKVSDQLNELST